MSRFKKWTSAENGLGSFARQHLTLDVRNQKGVTNKYYGVEIRHMINNFSKRNKLIGSYTERVLIISRHHYEAWKDFIISLKNQLNKMENWNDETIMPFGKHKGKKLANVPSEWFLWYHEYATNKNPQLTAYITENMVILLQENDLKNIKDGKY